MNQPWETENCDDVFAYYSIYPIPDAAALWCGIPAEKVSQYLSEATEITPGIWQHPKVKCLEAKCRAMQSAIAAGILPVSREDGIPATDHVAPARRRVSRQNLKEWISKEFPSQKPAFLFDELEQKSHGSINADTYRALQADRDALQTENEKLRAQNATLRSEKDALDGESRSLKKIVDKMREPDSRSETTYLNIIGLLVEIVLAQANSETRSTCRSQENIIAEMVERANNKPGISQRTLQSKFAEAKRSLLSA